MDSTIHWFTLFQIVSKRINQEPKIVEDQDEVYAGTYFFLTEDNKVSDLIQKYCHVFGKNNFAQIHYFHKNLD